MLNSSYSIYRIVQKTPVFSKEELLMLKKIFKQQEKGQDEVGTLTFLL